MISHEGGWGEGGSFQFEKSPWEKKKKTDPDKKIPLSLAVDQVQYNVGKYCIVYIFIKV